MSENNRIGLTSQEVEERIRQGKVNRTTQKTSRSVQEILYANFLSVANVVLLLIVVVLVIVGQPIDAILTGGVVIANVIIGSFQEYRSKRKLDQIALLTRPQVKVVRDNQVIEISQDEVVVDDAIVLKAGDQAVVDGHLVGRPEAVSDEAQRELYDSLFSSSQRVDMDESLLTGEADLIAKYPGDEILSGSFCVVGEGVFVAEKVGEESYAQKLTQGAREFTRVLTPLQKQISILVRTLAVLAISLTLMLGLSYAFNEQPFDQGVEDAAVIISLVPQGLLLLITLAYALGAVRIAGRGALVQQSNAVESMSHVNMLCLDKTGTLTTNRILFNELHPCKVTDKEQFRRYIGDYIKSTGAANRTANAISEAIDGTNREPVTEIPFSSARKWAAASFDSDDMRGTFVLGAPEMVLPNETFDGQANELTRQGLRVLVFARSDHIVRPDEIPDDRDADLPPNLKSLGLISFSDELRPDVNQVLGNFRRAKIKLKLISGDNPETVASLARQAGFSEEDKLVSGTDLAKMSAPEFTETVRTSTIFGRITPEQKKAIVDVLRNDGHYVAMMGDGVNDVLSLKHAQIGIAMESGSQATRSVADIVLLGDKFEALPHAFLEGQRILNGMSDVTRLFLTRTLYTVLLVIVAGFMATEFPFTPRHNFLLTTLPLGIPAFFLTAWAKPGNPNKSLIRSVSQFVLPAGFSLFVVTVFIWVLYLSYGVHDDVDTPRTVLTISALLGGFWIIILAEHQREEWHTGEIKKGDPRRIWLTVIMVTLFIIVMAFETLREFFELTTLSLADVGIVVVTMAAWAQGLFLMLRYDLLERLFIPDYSHDGDISDATAQKNE